MASKHACCPSEKSGDRAKASLPRRFFTPARFGFFGGSELAFRLLFYGDRRTLRHPRRPASSEPATLKSLTVRLNLLMVASSFAQSPSRKLKKCPLRPRRGFSSIPPCLFRDRPGGAACGGKGLGKLQERWSGSVWVIDREFGAIVINQSIYIKERLDPGSEELLLVKVKIVSSPKRKCFERMPSRRSSSFGKLG